MQTTPGKNYPLVSTLATGTAENRSARPSGPEIAKKSQKGFPGPPACCPYSFAPGPSGPESAKSLRKSLPGPSGPGLKKCPTPSRKSLRSLKKDWFETPETLLRLFRTLFGPHRGDSFGDSSKGRAGSQKKEPKRCQIS